MRLKSTLEQWVTLQEIDKAGSIQAAAESLNKSHTTLIYSIRKLEEQLDVKLLEIKGRRATLTELGKSLLRRASSMLEQAVELEDLSQQISAGVESEITVSIDHLCDQALLYRPMAEYLKRNKLTSIRVLETSLSKTHDVVTNEQADIAIINLPITNYPAQSFSLTTMVPVVSTEHPLASEEQLCMSDFATHCQIVIRDLGSSNQAGPNNQDVGWLKSKQRITVDNFDHAFRAVELGVGFCRLPTHIVAKRNRGQLKILEVEQNGSYRVPLHITLPKGAKTGPAAKCFYDLLLEMIE
ncbi:LysR family transcriptional regulator [Vibrio parahaemolyticus]|uniref:LysR family transcriptional regulator n=1 Tax=Vibrio parahaemolyticus TaxID=670 RepID=UPI0023605124|nr:LysR family transcriptional regulator [Vibrio parahaemolyticus]EGR3452508.1 LysR family transcriptional regulator [Vibrio parahaemolyticus]EGR3457063.1 LysR family transcriptional regulator [Vibrio parahaemolyticus]